MGLVDRIIRVLIVISIAILYFTNLISGTAALVLGVLSLVFILTSISSFCPLYFPCGIRTNKK